MGASISSIYQYIYLGVVAVLTFICIRQYRQKPAYEFRSSNGLLLAIVASLAIGLRPISGYFVDMSAYSLALRRLNGEPFEFIKDTDNIIFDNLIQWWGSNGFNEQLFFLLIAIIYFGCAYIGIKKLFPEHTKIAFVAFLGAFSTFSYATNGIKAGAAASIFIMALGYMDKLWVCIPLMLVSYGFHHSMILPIAAFGLTIVLKKPQWFYFGWLVCFIFACLHITYFQSLFGNMADDQGSLYLLATSETTDAQMRFRPDFVLYSAVPVWLGYQFEIKHKAIISPTYKRLMHFYLAANAVWMLCMYASFTNRIAYLSWFVYPILITYPFLDKANPDPLKYTKLRKAVYYHLFFTLFMYIVYYGLLSLGR